MLTFVFVAYKCKTLKKVFRVCQNGVNGYKMADAALLADLYVFCLRR